ncbi:hypothetical protein BJ878DRAFT_481615 [Calycina marina]|uniref:Uncharacterized protein n=1 Tax=Calycina marina TaxID=1763456 RepID=A0A9P7YZL3_9HELO|nr:hypothetical protein BJ878DRAFT_481615 [Calycina marina]
MYFSKVHQATHPRPDGAHPTRLLLQGLAKAQLGNIGKNVAHGGWSSIPTVRGNGYHLDPMAPRRHSSLLYRRLAVELAIGMDELETAAAIMTGKKCNPFYIEENHAAAMVQQLIINHRASSKEGSRLASGRVGWREILDRLAQDAWKVNEEEYLFQCITCAEDILHVPSSEKEIKSAENKSYHYPRASRRWLQGVYRLFADVIYGTNNISHNDDEGDLVHYRLERMNSQFSEGFSIVEIQTACENADGFHYHYVPPEAGITGIDGKELRERAYVYWNSAPWRGEDGLYDSIRDWVASLVEHVEDMAETGEKV